MSDDILFTTKRVGYHGAGYCFIVPDHAAGNRNRYTVYHVPTSPSRRIRIIGRELPLGHAKKLAKQKIRSFVSKTR